MTLQQFVDKYNGKIVADGQCGNLVRAYWNEVDLTKPPSYPNSKDYWYNPVPGYDRVSNPQPGDIAIYDGHRIYTEGHSAIYYGDGLVFEQNADPNGSPAHLFKRANTYLLGYLRKQGNQGGTILDDKDITAMYLAAGKSVADATLPANLNYYRGKKPEQLANDLYKGNNAGNPSYFYKASHYEADVKSSYDKGVADGGGKPTILTKGVYQVN